MSIPDEAVEAAARSIESCFDLSLSLGVLARAALEAAAPHMLAGAKAGALEEAANDMELDAQALGFTGKPVVSAAWLRKRAETHRSQS